MTSSSASSKFAIVDIETTGGNSDGNKITEVAIITVDDGVVTEEWSSLINPERSIPWGITKLTGIDDGMVQDAPKFFQVAKKIVELTEGRVFVAHNVFFDYRFLQREFQDLGFPFRRDVLCTVRLARRAFPGLASYSLHNLSKHFNLTRLAEHRALDDTRACLEIFQRASTLLPLQAQEELSPKLPAGLSDDTLEKLPARPGTYAFYSGVGLLLYIGKAKNLRARVTQHFQTLGQKKRELEMRQLLAKVEHQEWGSEFVASLMELHLIKTRRPLMNRAGRKTRFRFSLYFHRQASAGEEVTVGTHAAEGAEYGSRTSAELAREKVWKQAFGLDLHAEDFAARAQVFKTALGELAYWQRLEKAFNDTREDLRDGDYEVPGRRRAEQGHVVVREGRIREVRFVDAQGEVEFYPVEDHPDMRRLFLKHVEAGSLTCAPTRLSNPEF